MGIVTDVILPLALAFIMFSLGLGLTLEDFSRVVKQPRDFILGALPQIILLPLVAFLLVKVWPLSPEIALGVMIIAAAPGGVTSTFLSEMGRLLMICGFGPRCRLFLGYLSEGHR